MQVRGWEGQAERDRRKEGVGGEEGRPTPVTMETKGRVMQ